MSECPGVTVTVVPFNVFIVKLSPSADVSEVWYTEVNLRCFVCFLGEHKAGLSKVLSCLLDMQK